MKYMAFTTNIVMVTDGTASATQQINEENMTTESQTTSLDQINEDSQMTAVVDMTTSQEQMTTKGSIGLGDMTEGMMTDDMWQTLAKDNIKQQLSTYHPSQYTLEMYNKADGPDQLSKILYTDIKTYMTGGFWSKWIE